MQIRSFLIVLCLAFSAVQARKKRPSPFRFKELIDDVELDETKIRKRHGSVFKRTATTSSAICKYPVAADVKTVDNGKSLPIPNFGEYLSSLSCYTPRPVLLKIHAPSHMIVIPEFVTLHRCVGVLLTGNLKHCVATEREKIEVLYEDLITRIIYRHTMYNHTQCTSSCIKTADDCNPNESFSNCYCGCNINEQHCKNTKRPVFDSANCNCRCMPGSKCPLYREWNETECKCKCAKCLKKICEDAGKQINESTCGCILNKK